MPDNISEQNDSKDKKASRWGNSSPKSIVSEEENWDDEGERNNDGSSSSNSVVPLPQTEPIDDDSDVDFDDGAAATVNERKSVPNEIGDTGDGNEINEIVDDVQQNEPQQSVPLQQPVEIERSQPKSFDIFDDNVTATIRPQETAFNDCDDKDVGNFDNQDEATECNTTPLYDEPEEKKDSTEMDERDDIAVNVESTEEKKLEPELPGVPGIDE